MADQFQIVISSSGDGFAYDSRWEQTHGSVSRLLHKIAYGVSSARGDDDSISWITDVCAKLGITKPNTAVYHLECNGMVQRFNRTLKAILCKRASRFVSQWDRYLSGILWAYRNILHDSTGEKYFLELIVIHRQKLK